jgi:DnaJ-class molecular chaperone
MARDHYLILGVPRYESDRGIHAAFRVLAKRYHPDVAGEQAAARFREVVEAYEVLSDPERRRGYDEGLERASFRVSEPREHLRTTGHRPEPLVPEALSIANDFDVVRPSREDPLRRLRHNFIGRAPKGEHVEPLDVVVPMHLEQARRGGIVRLGVPVPHRCPYCLGTGRDWVADCPQCGGEGGVTVDHPIRVHVPPFFGQRAVLDVPLFGLGIGNLYLRLHLHAAT